MKVLTTTLCYPTPDRPEQGLFVQRRALAMAKLSPPGVGNERGSTDVRVVSPVPWCPLLRPARAISDQTHPLEAVYPRMLSVPMLNWATDGLSYARAIERVITARRGPGAAAVDLIDAHFVYPDGVGAWLAGRRLGVPVVVTVRGKIVSLSRRAIRRAQIRTMLRGVAGRIAVSRSLADWVHEIAGSDLHVDVIPNGVDTVVYHLVERNRARSILGWAPAARYLLAVGHLQKLKGFDRLVGVLPAARAVGGDVRLMLVGSQRGERRFARQLQSMIDRCNADAGMNPRTPCVQFVGPVPSDQLNLMYNAADLLVSASRSEGWNNAIAESLAAGTPVVAMDVGGNREQICSTELGTIVADHRDRLRLRIPLPEGRSGLAGAIIAALSREWNRLLISAHGSARTWSHVADEVHAVFARVLAARNERACPRRPDPVPSRSLAQRADAAIEVSR